MIRDYESSKAWVARLLLATSISCKRVMSPSQLEGVIIVGSPDKSVSGHSQRLSSVTSPMKYVPHPSRSLIVTCHHKTARSLWIAPDSFLHAPQVVLIKLFYDVQCEKTSEAVFVCDEGRDDPAASRHNKRPSFIRLICPERCKFRFRLNY